jgi:hypothetical protein
MLLTCSLAIQEATQAAEGTLPVAAVLLGPLRHLANRNGIQLADLLSAVTPRLNEVRALKVGKMFRNGLL